MTDNFILDPDALLDYQRDWTDWLAAVGDTIATSTWIMPTGLTSTREERTDTTATVWIKATVDAPRNTWLRVTNRITTVGGRTDDRTFTIKIQDR